MKIDPIIYNTLVYYSCMYGIQDRPAILRNLSSVLKGRKIRKEVMQDILSECRARPGSLRVQKFYQELIEDFDHEEFKEPKEARQPGFQEHEQVYKTQEIRRQIQGSEED